MFLTNLCIRAAYRDNNNMLAKPQHKLSRTFATSEKDYNHYAAAAQQDYEDYQENEKHEDDYENAEDEEKEEEEEEEVLFSNKHQVCSLYRIFIAVFP